MMPSSIFAISLLRKLILCGISAIHEEDQYLANYAKREGQPYLLQLIKTGNQYKLFRERHWSISSLHRGRW